MESFSGKNKKGAHAIAYKFFQERFSEREPGQIHCDLCLPHARNRGGAGKKIYCRMQSRDNGNFAAIPFSEPFANANFSAAQDKNLRLQKIAAENRPKNQPDF